MLAAGRRAVYYVSAGVHEKSGDGEAERWNVPDAGVRRADDGNALADAEAWRGTFSASAREKSGGKNCGERGDWRGPGDDAGGDAADSAGFGRDDVRGIFAARAGGNGGVRNK